MHFKNYQHLKNKETILLILLFIISFFVRIPSILILGDTSLDHEWGTIVNNLHNHGEFALSRFKDFFVPNLYMPPLYVFYIYFFKIFNFSNDVFILSILLSQVILSSFSVIIFYYINRNFFSKEISIIGASIFSLFPIHIFACGQISSAVLQIFLLNFFIYLFFKISKNNNRFHIYFLSLISGLLILTRGEFILLFIFSIFYLSFFSKIKIKNLLIIVIATTIVLSPYLVRNLLVFNKFTITKSVGINLWKGNNPRAGVEGKNYIHREMTITSYNSVNNLELDLDEQILVKQISEVPKNKYFEINVDKIFFQQAIKNIKNKPIKYFKLYLKKMLTFIFIDLNSSYPNYYHPLHFLPILFIGITSIIGIVLSNKNSYQMNFLILFFVANIAIVSAFFILPRYKLAILGFQIIFSNILFEKIKKLFSKNNKTNVY